ncbi:MAG: ATP-binding protein [Bacteroidota bacterium]
MIAKSARMLGDTYRRMDDLPSAKQYLNLAIDYSKVVNHLIHSSLAKVAQQEDNLRATLYHHEQALAYLENRVGARRRPIPYIDQLKNVGDAHFQLREYPKAVRYYDKALDFAKEEKLEYETAGEISLAMAETYQVLGNYKKALEYYQSGNLYMDSLREATAQERLAELEVRFKTQEKEQQIEYLNQTSEQGTRERNWLLAGIVLFLLLSAAIYSINRERKKIIDQLAAKNNETQQLYEELKTTQAQLVQSEKMISLGQLTAGIAHEINNLINFIASNIAALKLDFEDLRPFLEKAKQLENGVPGQVDIQELSQLSKEVEVSFISEELDEIISSIERGIHRTKDIISSLRAFSRNTPDKFELADLHLALESVLVILGHQLKKKAIVIEKQFGRIPLVSCNIGLLNQVFSNIIANAIQAVEGEGKGSIGISTQLSDEQVVVKIKDNGSGMQEEVLQKIFEPFYTTKEVGKGIGLGLSISYNIVQQHEGDIQVESQVGEGTTFSILLPLERTASS